MTTQTKHLFEVFEVTTARAIEVANRTADTQTPVSPAPRAGPLSYCSNYKGYGVTASARPTNSHLYAADVAIERSGCSTRHFRALDYFYTEVEALGYATRWARIWVDHQLRKVVAKAAMSIGNVKRKA